MRERERERERVRTCVRACVCVTVCVRITVGRTKCRPTNNTRFICEQLEHLLPVNSWS